MFLKALKKLQVLINDQERCTSTVRIIKNNVIIDGNESWVDDSPVINVTVKGDCEEVSVTCGSITVEGNASEVESTSGNISCGDVRGDVLTTSGNVKCGNVSGTIRTTSGDVRHR